ncbi:hypothetical protein FQR65_LT19334 [Abscondita terminalis]|nr:hypothetical protein FQR65_LT19334 [Abscondita terminalis]
MRVREKTIKCVCFEFHDLDNKNRTPLDKLEEISQTDLQCIWSVQKNRCKENYKAVNITNMPCFKKKVKKQVQLNLDTKNKEHIQVNMNLLKQSALYLHRMGRVSSLPTLHNTNVTDNEELYITNVLNNSYQSILMLEMPKFQYS